MANRPSPNWQEKIPLIYHLYILPSGGLYATDPTFYGNQKQPLSQIKPLSGWDWEVRNFRSQGPRDLGCAVVYLQNVQGGPKNQV